MVIINVLTIFKLLFYSIIYELNIFDLLSVLCRSGILQKFYFVPHYPESLFFFFFFLNSEQFICFFFRIFSQVESSSILVSSIFVTFFFFFCVLINRQFITTAVFFFFFQIFGNFDSFSPLFITRLSREFLVVAVFLAFFSCFVTPTEWILISSPRQYFWEFLVLFFARVFILKNSSSDRVFLFFVPFPLMDFQFFRILVDSVGNC